MHELDVIDGPAVAVGALGSVRSRLLAELAGAGFTAWFLAGEPAGGSQAGHDARCVHFLSEVEADASPSRST